MQHEMFMAQMISARGVPAIGLPPAVIVRAAQRQSATRVESGGIVIDAADPSGALCRELVRIGAPETHLQVFDGRSACFFMRIDDAAA